MKTGKGIRKIPDGKLVKIEIEFDDSIKEIKIMGDFFCYPENIIPEIEDILKNKEIPLGEESVKSIQEIVKKGDLIGVSAKDIVEVINEATQ